MTMVGNRTFDHGVKNRRRYSQCAQPRRKSEPGVHNYDRLRNRLGCTLTIQDLPQSHTVRKTLHTSILNDGLRVRVKAKNGWKK